MTQTYLHTVGDSTLDNLFWMIPWQGTLEQAKKLTVEGRLESATAFTVISHAYDGFTTESVLNGDRIGRVLPGRGSVITSYLKEKGQGEVKPLENLSKVVALDSEGTHYVILSVGGNDFRERLMNPIALLTEIPRVQERYLQIVKQIRELQGRDIRPLLMFQYRTGVNQDPYHIHTLLRWVGRVAVALNLVCLATLALAPLGVYKEVLSRRTGVILGTLASGLLFLSTRGVPFKVTLEVVKGHDLGMTVFGALLEKLYAPILEEAKTHHIPILDLSNTLDPYHDENYISGIEPGIEGSKTIAEGLAHIVKEHDYQGASRLYAKPPRGEGPYTSTINDPSRWKVQYISQ
ncbi:MAG: hypothetical protein AB7N99_07650 [Simkaniaceae bacterium]